MSEVRMNEGKNQAKPLRKARMGPSGLTSLSDGRYQEYIGLMPTQHIGI